MELVERFSFFTYIEDGPLDLGTPRDLKGQALPFSYLARSLFDTSPEAAAAARLYEDWPLYFVPATNLTRGEAVYLPIHWFYLIEEYNGPAAGNCLEEAILQGLGEVVERHVGSVISHDRLPTPVIDPDSVTDPAARELLEKFQKNGIVLHLRDFSMDTGIPTVAALAYDPSTFPAGQRDRLCRGHHHRPHQVPGPGLDRGGPTGRGFQPPHQLPAYPAQV